MTHSSQQKLIWSDRTSACAARTQVEVASYSWQVPTSGELKCCERRVRLPEGEAFQPGLGSAPRLPVGLCRPRAFSPFEVVLEVHGRCVCSSFRSPSLEIGLLFRTWLCMPCPVTMLCCASYKPAEAFCRARGHVSWSCGAVNLRSFIRLLALVAFFDTWLELFASGVETSIGTLPRYIPGSSPGKESSAPTGQWSLESVRCAPHVVCETSCFPRIPGSTGIPIVGVSIASCGSDTTTAVNTGPLSIQAVIRVEGDLWCLSGR